MSDQVTFSLSKTQLKVAKKAATQEMEALFQEELCNLARRVARKYIKENKNKLEFDALAKLEAIIDNSLDAVVEDAMKRTHLCLLDY